MIFSVLVAILSLCFGVYKNVEAGNAREFAYEQAYRMMGVVGAAPLTSSAKATLLDAATASLGAPAPVLDFSSSSAGAPTSSGSCTVAQRSACIQTAREVARINMTCAQRTTSPEACAQLRAVVPGDAIKSCVVCFQ